MANGSERSSGFRKEVGEGEFGLTRKEFRSIFIDFEKKNRGAQWRGGFWKLLEPLIDDPDNNLNVQQVGVANNHYRLCERYSLTADGELFLWKDKPVNEELSIRNEYSWFALGEGKYPLNLLPRSFESSLKQLVVRMYWLSPDTRAEFIDIVELFNSIQAGIKEESEDENGELGRQIRDQVRSLIKFQALSMTYFDYQAVWFSNRDNRKKNRRLARISFHDAYIPNNFEDKGIDPAILRGYDGRSRRGVVWKRPDETSAGEIDRFITRLSKRA